MEGAAANVEQLSQLFRLARRPFRRAEGPAGHQARSAGPGSRAVSKFNEAQRADRSGAPFITVCSCPGPAGPLGLAMPGCGPVSWLAARAG